MLDYSCEIESFLKDKVKMSNSFREKLFDHRKANRDRLISRLPNQIEGLSVNQYSFKPQGSMAMKTIIQTKFKEDEYDIDDGLVLSKKELVDKSGDELTPQEIREIVLNSLKDDRFVKQPKFCTNCVRVFYSETDEEKHHVDFPIYRKFKEDDDYIRELANEDKWIRSNPTQINSWFEDEICSRNDEEEFKGSQLRELIQLLKRFSKSRKDWDLPNGLKLTMLANECQKKYYSRVDEAFRELLKEMKQRLNKTKIIKNLAHPDKPEITRTPSDSNVENLLEKISLALEKLKELDKNDCDKEKSRKVWDWIFKSDGYFESLSQKNEEENNFASHTPSRTVDKNGGSRFGEF